MPTQEPLPLPAGPPEASLQSVTFPFSDSVADARCSPWQKNGEKTTTQKHVKFLCKNGEKQQKHRISKFNIVLIFNIVRWICGFHMFSSQAQRCNMVLGYQGDFTNNRTIYTAKLRAQRQTFFCSSLTNHICVLGSTGHVHLDSWSQTKASAQRGHLPTHQTTGWSVKNLTLSATSSRSSWAQLSSQSTTSCRQQSHHQAVVPRKGQGLSYSLFMAQLRTHFFLTQCLSMTLFYKGQGLSSSSSLFKALLRTHLFLT